VRIREDQVGSRSVDDALQLVITQFVASKRDNPVGRVDVSVLN